MNRSAFSWNGGGVVVALSGGILPNVVSGNSGKVVSDIEALVISI